jgi:adenine-specific DNA-methyltransferase
VVDRATRDRLIAEHPSSAEVLKPYLRGRDVKRWRTEPQDLWLIFTRRGIEIDEYPAIKKYLEQFKSRLTPGITGGRKAGSYAWHEIQDNIRYWQEFEQPKIIYPDIYEHQSFTIDTNGFYSANTCYFIPLQEPWSCGLLNSQIVEWLYSRLSNKVRGGYLRAFTDYMEQIPIPQASTKEQKAISSLVNKCLDAKGQNVAKWEAEIDDRVARLYGLTPDEIKLIRGE